MDTKRIKQLIEELDASVPREDARLLMSIYGGGADESQMIGTANGYMRFGVELLKAAASQPATGSDTPNAIYPDIEYVIHPNSTVCFDWFERKDPETPPAVTSGGNGRTIAFAIIGSLCAIAALALFGAYTILHMAFI